MIKYGGGFAEAPWLKHGFDALWSLYIPFHLVYSFVFPPFSFIKPFLSAFLSSGLSLYNLLYSLQDIKSLNRSNTSKLKEWTLNLQRFSLLPTFPLKVSSKAKTFQYKPQFSMWQCHKAAMERPSAQGHEFCIHNSQSLKIVHSLCRVCADYKQLKD